MRSLSPYFTDGFLVFIIFHFAFPAQITTEFPRVSGRIVNGVPQRVSRGVSTDRSR